MKNGKLLVLAAQIQADLADLERFVAVLHQLGEGGG